MKHLTLFLALVLCTSSFSKAQFVTVTSVVYDSLEVYFGDESYTATVDVQSNAVYTAEFHFFWSSDREEISNGGGQEILPSITITPGVVSRTDMYSLFPQFYASAGQFGGIFFRLYYDVVDEEGNVVQSYVSPVRTWRFPMDVSTFVDEKVESDKLTIFPNPTMDRFTVSSFTGSTVQMVSAHGKISSLLGQGGTFHKGDLSPGLYTVLDNQGLFLGRVVVQ